MKWLAIVRRQDGTFHKEPMGISASATEICRRWYEQHDTGRVSLVGVIRGGETDEIIKVLSEKKSS